MPTAKRASMREGPLAALFRKTAEDTATGSPAQEGSRPAAEETQRGQTLPAPDPRAASRASGADSGRQSSRSPSTCLRRRSACSTCSRPTSRRT